MADKKKGYLKSTEANDALFNNVTPMLFNVHKNNHKLLHCANDVGDIAKCGKHTRIKKGSEKKRIRARDGIVRRSNDSRKSTYAATALAVDDPFDDAVMLQ
jgi:hypothetical protein